MGRQTSLLKIVAQRAAQRAKHSILHPSQAMQAKRTRTKSKYKFNFDPEYVKAADLKFSCKIKYSCQLSLLIILNSRSFDTLRLISHDDSRRSIEAEHRRTSISFHNFFEDGRLPIKLSHLRMLEERLVAALSALHANRIYYPISAGLVRFLPPLDDAPDDAIPRLYLNYNQKAKWASRRLPETWQADQLSHARCLFRIPKLFLQLCSSPDGFISFDLQEQQTLETYIRELSPPFHHVDLLINAIVPMTAQLATAVILYLVKKKKGQIAHFFFETLFGPCAPLLDPKASPQAIFEIYLQQRRHQYIAESQECSIVVDKSFEDEVLRFSPETLAVFVRCRAEVASMLGDDDKEEWWLMEKNLRSALFQGSIEQIRRE
ncbi:hypothetical protein F4818DRAFT_87123 [Hypoxylon cercidicola]|nr:hypothetical protein F4818DRAFT_87123 [Hypoxylon cercidicola]